MWLEYRRYAQNRILAQCIVSCVKSSGCRVICEILAKQSTAGNRSCWRDLFGVMSKQVRCTGDCSCFLCWWWFCGFRWFCRTTRLWIGKWCVVSNNTLCLLIRNACISCCNTCLISMLLETETRNFETETETKTFETETDLETLTSLVYIGPKICVIFICNFNI